MWKKDKAAKLILEFSSIYLSWNINETYWSNKNLENWKNSKNNSNANKNSNNYKIKIQKFQNQKIKENYIAKENLKKHTNIPQKRRKTRHISTKMIMRLRFDRNCDLSYFTINNIWKLKKFSTILEKISA